MVTAIGCCRLFIQDRALQSLSDTIPPKLGRKVQQHEMLENVEDRQVLRTITVPIRLAFSDECCGSFIRVCEELSHRGVSLVSVCFKSIPL